jgi:hypothetical protein
MRQCGARGWWLAAVGAASWVAVLSTCHVACAQSNEASAEALFEQGRDLLRAGKAAQACPLLAESQRLDPAGGTLLALAMCHEAEGKLASAWAEFVDVEGRSRSEGRTDRVQVAHDHARALKPRLSTLLVSVPSELGTLAGIEIRNNGVLLGAGGWNLAVPVDGGQYAIAISAPGKLGWQKTVQVKPESDAAVLDAPSALEPAPAESPRTGAANPSAELPPEPAPTASRWGTLEWAGVATAGVGVVGLGLGGYFLSSALGKKSDSNQDCGGNACGTQGFAERTSAVSRGNTATVFAVAGGALVAGGATLFIVGRTKGHSTHSDSGSGSSAPNRAALVLGAGPAGLAAAFSTPF